MEFLPDMVLGWLNGWLPIAAFYIVFIILMLFFPKEVFKKLFSIKGWGRQQQILSAIGKPFSLTFLTLLVFLHLRIGTALFLIGMGIYTMGFVVMLVALFNFKSTPSRQPVRKGVYTISRNPQWLALLMMFSGCALAVGSWLNLLLLSISAIFYHFRILGEERACLQVYSEPYQQYLEQVPRYLLFF